MAFVSLGMLELIHSFNIKSEQSILKSEIFNNKYLIGAFILGAILQIGVVLVPKVADIFKLVPFIIEIQKKFNEIKFGKVIYNDSKMENAKKYTI